MQLEERCSVSLVGKAELLLMLVLPVVQHTGAELRLEVFQWCDGFGCLSHRSVSARATCNSQGAVSTINSFSFTKDVPVAQDWEGKKGQALQKVLCVLHDLCVTNISGGSQHCNWSPPLLHHSCISVPSLFPAGTTAQEPVPQLGYRMT